MTCVVINRRYDVCVPFYLQLFQNVFLTIYCAMVLYEIGGLCIRNIAHRTFIGRNSMIMYVSNGCSKRSKEPLGPKVHILYKTMWYNRISLLYLR